MAHFAARKARATIKMGQEHGNFGEPFSQGGSRQVKYLHGYYNNTFILEVLVPDGSQWMGQDHMIQPGLSFGDIARQYPEIC